VAATIPVGRVPVDVSISPDGSTAYVPNSGSNSVSVINTGTNAVSATVAVGTAPVNAAAF
jgi:YVTN family beta-propeller protein